MAGHTRTRATGTARRTSGGKTRKLREHLPSDQLDQHRRRTQRRGARSRAVDRISRTSDPLRRLDVAREYVMSAAAKYRDPGAVAAAVEALLAAGDRIYAHGAPLTPAERRTRRERANQHRQQRQRTAVLVREGQAAIRRQRKEADRTA
ncbi:hypothetical protein [Amycolatopsis arida]|uniref:hypothetical protein n=1 Tax=Amycolatopsis arida TaxID=587909 RepID=UPI001066FD6E|nr:hypothetical protein [Amycolatopsis arida]TDX84963.1 hypothetical protein CLV69_11747 [Amycolatopsis arida]